MFDFIPLQSYTGFYYHSMFAISLMIWLHSMMFDIKNPSSVVLFQVVGSSFLVFVILYMGLRPISLIFGDMSAYANGFRMVQAGKELKIEDDYLFNYFLLGCSKIMSAHSFFLLVDVLYILPCYFFSRKFFGSYWFFGFFMFVGSFVFWSYGTNGIRNGLATAIFITALLYYERKIVLYCLFALSFTMHASMVIPIAAYFVAAQYKNPKLYIQIWLIAIPLSFFGGTYFETLFSTIGFEDRVRGYLTNKDIVDDQAAIVGFRWDFLIYSATAVAAGWYFIFKKGITDQFYIHLFGIYTITNAFWILVIRANFSNRFAYLSWFLMAAVIGYPMFRYKLWNDQYRVFGIVLFCYYLFTYLMFLKGSI